jgi:hypothetical protein
MSRFFALILVFAFALSSTTLAAPGKGKGKAAAKTTTLTGTVVGYQEHKKHKQLVISVPNDDGKSQEQSVRIDDSTKITLNGNSVAASALRAGEKVTVTLSKKVATEVAATSN